MSMAEADAAPVRLLVHADTTLDAWDRIDALTRAQQEAKRGSRSR